MAHAIVKAQPRDPVAVGTVLAQSGYFSDARQAAQAAVKVMAGEELGLGPVASMTGIHIVKDKVTVGANLLAALIRKHPDYDYAVKEHTDQVCAIEFTYKGKPAGVSTFSMDDATKAGLLNNPTWKKWPMAMLFARAITQGQRWYAPDVAAGSPLYTPDELGADVEYDDGGEIVSVRVDAPTPVQDDARSTAINALQESDPGLAQVVADVPPPLTDAERAKLQQPDDFDPKTVIETLKQEFGAEVVKGAFQDAEITRFSDLTPERADAIREQLQMEGAA